MNETNWDEVLKDITGKIRKTAKNQNWDKVLEDIQEEIIAKGGVRELVRYARLQQNLSLSELAEETDVSEKDLIRACEEGEEVDSKIFFRVALWLLRKAEESIGDKDSKGKLRLAILLCRLALYGKEKDMDRFIDLVASFGENQKESSEEQ